jgi:non-specific serine/threonine protein kinase
MTVLGRGDVSRARALATESVEIFREGDDPFGLGVAMASRGIVAVSERDSATAEALLTESATRLRAAGDDWGASLPLRNLAVDAFRRGDYPRAVALHQEAIRLLQPREEEWFLSRSLESLAETLALVGEPLRAARLFGAAERLRQRIGAAVLAFYRPDYDRAQAALRAALDPQTLEAAWAEGQAMSLAETIACALDGPRCPPSVAPAAPAPRADPVAVLTAREREVAALLARGMTNRQIAATLVVTEKTAEAHVSHILAKLGLTSRAQAAVWAAQHRLGGGAAG